MQYHIGIQLLAFILIAPYISTSNWSPAFENTLRPLNTIWCVHKLKSVLHHAYIPLHNRFSLFQVVSAYTNTGTSLVDESMLPFQKAYLMIIVLMLLILAGNTSFVSVINPTEDFDI